MVNYNNGKIYKIEDVNGEMCYIGSTTKERLCQRMSEHRQAYKKWKADKSNNKFTVFDIFDKMGFENCEIVLIELCPCDTKDELTKCESRYIRNTICVNRIIPDRTQTEWQKANYIANRDAIIQKTSDYRKNNKAKIKEYKSVQITCECSKTHIHDGTARHLRSKFYINFIASRALVLDV